MRDDSYLNKRLNHIWSRYFSDVPKKEAVKIYFGREAVYRFGSIKFCYTDRSVKVTINGRFKDKKYPQGIIDHTIAHELVHYAQGFPTLGPRLHRYPHRGGVIDKELKERKLGHLVAFYHAWVKDYLINL